MSKMVMKKMLVIITVFFFYSAYSEKIYINESKDEIYINNVLLNSPLINKALASIVSDGNEIFEIENLYTASALTKTNIKYSFNKNSGKLQSIKKINHNTKFDSFDGYYINLLDGGDIRTLDYDDMEEIEEKADLIDYSFLRENGCLVLNLTLRNEEKKISYCNMSKNYGYVIKYTKNSSASFKKNGYFRCKFNAEELDFSMKNCIKIDFINEKTYLYTAHNKKTKMYLIKGDVVEILNKKTDDNNQKWYFINYKGKKDLKMWIKAETVDVTDGD